MTKAGGVVSYFLPDGLGSTANVTDASGTVTATYTYDVFGAIRTQTGSSTNPFLFTGELKDNESGYSYLRARYYDPATGRFVSRDPLGGGYVYANNNPVRLTDPSGLFVNDPSEYDSYADYLNAYAANHGDMATNWDGQGPPGSRASSEGDSSGGGCHFVAGGMDCGGIITALTRGSTFYLGAGYNAYVVVDSMGDASALGFVGHSSVGAWIDIGNIDGPLLVDPVSGTAFTRNSPWTEVKLGVYCAANISTCIDKGFLTNWVCGLGTICFDAFCQTVEGGCSSHPLPNDPVGCGIALAGEGVLVLSPAGPVAFGAGLVVTSAGTAWGCR